MYRSVETDDSRLSEFLDSWSPPADKELAVIAIALYLEEVFRISLTDEEISPETLGSSDSIRRLLRRKLGG